MRTSLKSLAVAAMTAGLMIGASGAAHAENVVDTEVRPPAGPCSDLPNAFVESGGRVGADLTIKCFE